MYCSHVCACCVLVATKRAKQFYPRCHLILDKCECFTNSLALDTEGDTEGVSLLHGRHLLHSHAAASTSPDSSSEDLDSLSDVDHSLHTQVFYKNVCQQPLLTHPLCWVGLFGWNAAPSKSNNRAPWWRSQIQQQSRTTSRSNICPQP